MQGYDVVTRDDHKIGHVVDEREECLIVEHGHVFKAKHAIPKTFAHVDEDAQVIRASITKDVFTDSPKVDDDWSCEVTNAHYGLSVEFDTNPDPEAVGDGETVSQQRAAFREGTAEGNDLPEVHERMSSAVDPTGVTANQAGDRPDLHGRD